MISAETPLAVRALERKEFGSSTEVTGTQFETPGAHMEPIYALAYFSLFRASTLNVYNKGEE